MRKEPTFRYGGQAVIDGVMMRGKTSVVVAVRRPNGDIALESRPISAFYNGFWRRVPFFRGMVVLLESLILGMGALNRSAGIALEEEVKEVPKIIILGIVAFTVLLAVGFFILLPFFITNPLKELIDSSFLFHLVEGVLRLVMFTAYVLLISMMKDIRNTFAYHGAEHATIAAYENGEALNAGTINSSRTAHARCGTSFVFMVLIIAILVFTFVGFQETWLMILFRLLLLPVIAALSYELLIFTSRHTANPIVKLIMQPGLLFQKLTTRRPNLPQIEVALAAFRLARQIDLAQGDKTLAKMALDLAQSDSKKSIDEAYETSIAQLLSLKEKEGMDAINRLFTPTKPPLEIIPAIDLINGKCVRLYQGDYQKVTEYTCTPAEMAQIFQKEGAHRIHVVDLDGAKNGYPINTASIQAICQNVHIPVEVGGGIRSMSTIESLFSLGVSRAILGTAAIHDCAFLSEALAKYSSRIVVGIDAKDGKVATHGWTQSSSLSAVELAKQMQVLGVQNIIYTDIAKDGTLSEPNYAMLTEIINAFNGNVIASGGISQLSQLTKLRELGAHGVIIGKAIYDGHLKVSEAVKEQKYEGESS